LAKLSTYFQTPSFNILFLFFQSRGSQSAKADGWLNWKTKKFPPFFFFSFHFKKVINTSAYFGSLLLLARKIILSKITLFSDASASASNGSQFSFYHFRCLSAKIFLKIKTQNLIFLFFSTFIFETNFRLKIKEFQRRRSIMKEITPELTERLGPDV
jgi:hypothetical protein